MADFCKKEIANKTLYFDVSGAQIWWQAFLHGHAISGCRQSIQ